MNEVMKFDFESNTIRTQPDAYGMAWFNAADICRALGYSNSWAWKVLVKLVNAKDVTLRATPTSSGIQMVNHINESGIYTLVSGISACKKASATRLEHWVKSEVLPTIRKTGSYNLQHQQAETSVSNQQAETSSVSNQQAETSSVSNQQAETSSVSNQQAETSSVSKKRLEAYDEFEAVFRTATLMGFDRKQAAFKANRWAFKATGVSLFECMEETTLIDEK